MALPLFDDVVVDAVPPRDGPVRIHEDRVPTAAHSSARLSAAPEVEFTLDGDYRNKSFRPAIVRPGDPRYFAYWNAFARGVDGQTPPGVEHDEQIARYAADGYHTGKIIGIIRQQARARGERETRERRWR